MMAFFSLVLVLGLLHTHMSHAACPPFQPNATFPPSSALPDPFTFQSGAKVLSKADWACRRTELLSLAQEYELGTLPPKPSFLNATLVNTTLSIEVQEGSQKIAFSVKIRLPATDKENTNSFPAIIGFGGSSVPLDNRIALITYNNEEMATQASTRNRGQGKFYNIYGSRHSAGAFIAWTWGVSRVIDALELLGPSVTRIDATRLGVTGCSRNGKGALIAGAFEPRIVLTIPQESGVGGSACWRLYEDLKCREACIPESDDPWTSSPWFRSDFPQNIKTSFARLPYDHHEIMGLVAPRGLFVLENDIDWLNPVASTVCADAGRNIYTALSEKEGFGFSLSSSHGHCQFPASQRDGLNTFLERYLFGGAKGGGVWESVKSDEAKGKENWAWLTPKLE